MAVPPSSLRSAYFIIEFKNQIITWNKKIG